MKKSILCLFLLSSIFLMFAEPYESLINEDADEEIIIVNKTLDKEAFKIYIHLKEKNGANVDVSLFNVDVTIDQKDEWIFLVKSPILDKKSKWKSDSDYKCIKNADKIRIETKSNKRYTYYFRTIHDKLYINVTDYDNENDW